MNVTTESPLLRLTRRTLISRMRRLIETCGLYQYLSKTFGTTPRVAHFLATERSRSESTANFLQGVFLKGHWIVLYVYKMFELVEMAVCLVESNGTIYDSDF